MRTLPMNISSVGVEVRHILLSISKWTKTNFVSFVSEWNPDVSPAFAMVDFDSAEIMSLQRVFPNISTFLCDFHREQAWNR